MTVHDPDVTPRFWSKVKKREGEDACWIWAAGRNSWGYGYIRVGRKMVRAHRFAYALVNGPILNGLCVLHSCDVRACVRPSHLGLGDQSENVSDQYRRGRREQKRYERLLEVDLRAERHAEDAREQKRLRAEEVRLSDPPDREDPLRELIRQQQLDRYREIQKAARGGGPEVR